MDDADRAGIEQEREIERAMAARVHPPLGESALFCVDCGEAIPRVRRLAAPGTMRCISCQLDKDRRDAWGF